MPGRILLFGLNFSPELVGIGKYSGELADYLVEHGFELHVVTTPPYYPEWKIKDGYSGWRYRKESAQKMTVYRCPLWVPRRPSNLNRLLHLISFAFSSFPVMLEQVGWKPNLVICVIPTLFSAPIAWLAARLCGAKCWLHIQDFELDAALNLGMLPGIFSLARAFERFILTRFDRISTISESMLKLAFQKGVAKENGLLFPNWVDTQLIYPLSEKGISLRHELGIPEGKVIVLYSGSMSAKQGLENLVYAAQQLRTNTDIVFVFCGEGAGRDELIKAAQDMPNIKYLPLQPFNKLNVLLNMADIHIMSQKANVADLVMPSKLLGMLASGRAIIATAYPDTEVGRVVRQVGILVSPEDTEGLRNAILDLAASPQTRTRLGESGRKYVCENWGADFILPRFLEQLNGLITGGV